MDVSRSSPVTALLHVWPAVANANLGNPLLHADGDHYPITVEGKLCCGACMLCGIMVLGLPMTVIGVSFDGAFKDAEYIANTKARKRDEKRCGSTNHAIAIFPCYCASAPTISRTRIPPYATA